MGKRKQDYQAGFITVKAAAEIMVCHPKTIYKLLKTKRFKTVQVGRAIRINKADFCRICQLDDLSKSDG